MLFLVTADQAGSGKHLRPTESNSEPRQLRSAEVRSGAEERRECRSCILSGKADIAFEHLLNELRLLAGSPKRRAMHDPIAKWSAVSAFAARDRPRNADELGAHFICAEQNRRIAVAAKVNELEMV